MRAKGIGASLPWRSPQADTFQHSSRFCANRMVFFGATRGGLDSHCLHTTTRGMNVSRFGGSRRMNPDLKRLIDYVSGLGIEDVAHTGGTYLAHLASVYHLMESNGCEPEICRAAIFHSIYGTQMFQGFKIPLDRRPELREVIGERAERLAYLNCAMDRATLDAALEQP